MPSCCVVPVCHDRGGFMFTADKDKKKRWEVAVRRVTKTGKKDWKASPFSRICESISSRVIFYHQRH